MHRRVVLTFLVQAAACGASLHAQRPATGDWPAYGRDIGGSRHSPLTRITRESVHRLEPAWTFHIGGPPLKLERGGEPSLETTPIMVDGTLYLTSPAGMVIALDPVSGKERWRHDPGVNLKAGYGDFTNRGVSFWRQPGASPSARCARRVFVATVDARLVALDARNGERCPEFGTAGQVDLRKGLRIPPFEFQAYAQTSPPLVINGLVIVGSAIGDNSRVATASGEVRAFDAHSGALRWTWHPIPQVAADPAFVTWENGSASTTGAANAWTVLVGDAERDLVFVPTSSAAPDYFGGLRKGENRYANSLVALQASTGQLVWHFQTVHHDLWDFDNASPAALTTVVRDGRSTAAVVQTTKTGMMFILNRETGAPLFPVEERRVPVSDVPGESSWPTQPFTLATPALVPHTISANDVWGTTGAEREACLAELRGLRNEGIFTPPSLRGTLVLPSNIGGAHWGGVAVDETRGIVVVPVNRLAAVVQLIPNEQYDRAAARGLSEREGWQYTPMGGTPYVMRRRLWLGPSQLPCTAPPFGALVAVNLATGRIRWEVPLGTTLMPDGTPATPEHGSPNLGGPLVTASGLVFMAGTLDRRVRAFDIDSGRELWQAVLPAGGKAAPMTYEVEGRQYVVIAAGGGGPFGAGDAIVAFALPTPMR